MADIDDVINAIESRFEAAGLKFDVSRAVVTLEIVGAGDRRQGLTVPLGDMLSAKDAAAFADTLVDAAGAHFDVLNRGDMSAIVNENVALKARVAELETVQAVASPALASTTI